MDLDSVQERVHGGRFARHGARNIRLKYLRFRQRYREKYICVVRGRACIGNITDHVLSLVAAARIIRNHDNLLTPGIG